MGGSIHGPGGEFLGTYNEGGPGGGLGVLAALAVTAALSLVAAGGIIISPLLFLAGYLDALDRGSTDQAHDRLIYLFLSIPFSLSGIVGLGVLIYALAAHRGKPTAQSHPKL
jgi:hypothetical protein